jgi:hypothetical protein
MRVALPRRVCRISLYKYLCLYLYKDKFFSRHPSSSQVHALFGSEQTGTTGWVGYNAGNYSLLAGAVIPDDSGCM